MVSLHSNTEFNSSIQFPSGASNVGTAPLLVMEWLISFQVETYNSSFGIHANDALLVFWSMEAYNCHSNSQSWNRTGAFYKSRNWRWGLLDGIMWSPDCWLKHLEWIVESRYCCFILRMFLGWFQVTLLCYSLGQFPLADHFSVPRLDCVTCICFGLRWASWQTFLSSFFLLRAWREAQ